MIQLEDDSSGPLPIEWAFKITCPAWKSTRPNFSGALQDPLKLSSLQSFQ